MCSVENNQVVQRLIIKPAEQGNKRQVFIGEKLKSTVAQKYFPKSLNVEINKGPLKNTCVNSVGRTCAKLKEKIFEKYCKLKANQISLSKTIKNKLEYCKPKSKNLNELNENKKSNPEAKISTPSVVPTQMISSAMDSANIVKDIEQMHQFFKYVINNCVEEKSIENDSDPSDDETEKQHPNRRLEMERTQNAPVNTTLLHEKARSLQNHIINNTRMNSKLDLSETHNNINNSTTRVSVFSRLQLSKTPSTLKHVAEQNKNTDLPKNKTMSTFFAGELNESDEKEIKTSEKSELRPSVFSRLGTKTPQKEFKASNVWMDVLDTSDFWKCEENNEINDDSNGCDKELPELEEEEQDYQEMLVDFVFNSVEENMKLKEETLYERRFKEKLLEPDCMILVNEFYISPAKVEVFYQKLTENMSAQECLNQVCLGMNWPKATYTPVTHSRYEGFIFSCQLKTRTFTPAKPASNTHLAMDLAASQCLDWLGIAMREGTYGFTEDTYFG